MATALKIKITPKDIKRSLGFALIKGEIATIAVAPHMAVPDTKSIDNLVSIFKTFEIMKPIRKITITKIEIYGKYFAVKVIAPDDEIVSPNITMPIWSSFVPIDFRINPSAEPINKVKLMPKNNAIKGDPIINAIKAKTIPNNKLIFFVVV